MYFIQMVNISNGTITDSKNVATVETRAEGIERITGNSNAIFIKGEDSYYDYAILTNIDIIKASSDNFIQSILDNNPHLKNIKDKKPKDEEIEEEA